jgi:imidazole glycerol-phosphate synthase subunit HisH
MIVIVDYGMGNLRSVSKALESLGAEVCVSHDPADILRADKLVLPGVGAFPAAMRELRVRSLIEPIKRVIADARKPYLGICLGLQLLFDSSEEGEGAKGLAVFPGTVKRFPQTIGSGLKVPHMGWNQVKAGARGEGDCPLMRGISENSYFYFVHSYYVKPDAPAVKTWNTDYGLPFTSMVWKDRLFATQFHPEKSQGVGLTLLKNFIEIEL